MPAYAIEAVGRPLAIPILEGRAPGRDDEIALGPATAAALGVDVGDRLPAGPDGRRACGSSVRRCCCEEGGHAAYDEGVWTTREGLERLEPPQVRTGPCTWSTCAPEPAWTPAYGAASARAAA